MKNSEETPNLIRNPQQIFGSEWMIIYRAGWIVRSSHPLSLQEYTEMYSA